MSVVRASTGTVLATLTGNNIAFAISAAFDGERVLIASNTNALSLFKAADLTPLGVLLLTGDPQPWGACSDGRNFWIVFSNTNQLARF